MPARNANVRNAQIVVEEDLDLRFLPNMQEEAAEAARMTVWRNPEVLHALVQSANAHRDVLKGIRPKNKPPGGEWMKRSQGWNMIASELLHDYFRKYDYWVSCILTIHGPQIVCPLSFAKQPKITSQL